MEFIATIIVPSERAPVVWHLIDITQPGDKSPVIQARTSPDGKVAFCGTRAALIRFADSLAAIVAADLIDSERKPA